MASDYTPHNDITGNFDEDAPDAPKPEFRGEAGEDNATETNAPEAVGTAQNSEEQDSLLDNLKSAGEAWLLAGSALGNVASHFADKFREDRESDGPQGAHAKEEAAGGFGQQLKAAIDNARESFNSSENDRDFRAAATSFASDAENIFRDFTGSLSRASDATANSPQTEDAKDALKDAVAEVRETFNQAVAGVRNRAEESDIDAEGTINEMRTRLDEIISKVTDQFDRDDTDSDIVEGEVVEDDTNQRAGE